MVGYLKVTCCMAMLPWDGSTGMPPWQEASMTGVRDRRPRMDLRARLALDTSGGKLKQPPVADVPVAIAADGQIPFASFLVIVPFSVEGPWDVSMLHNI